MATKRGSTPVRSDLHSAYFQAITLKSGQKKSFTSSSALSATLDDNTSIVKLFPTQDCWVKIGSGSGLSVTVPSDATQVAAATFLPGGIIEYLGIPENLTNAAIAVISNGSDGVLYITEGS